MQLAAQKQSVLLAPTGAPLIDGAPQDDGVGFVAKRRRRGTPGALWKFSAFSNFRLVTLLRKLPLSGLVLVQTRYERAVLALRCRGSARGTS